MAQTKSSKQLAKLIAYILGRRPDEFGLVLDSDGFVKIKDVLKAIHEEDGFKYVRRSHLNEICIVQEEPPFEIQDNLIRAACRDNLPPSKPAQNLPKHLYTCVRRKTYPVVQEKGIFPLGHNRVVLSSSRDMAERIGRRIDPLPVLLTVQTRRAMDQGIVFYTAGETLYVAETIHTNCFSGPLLPKQQTMPPKPEISEEHTRQRPPGSYLVDLMDIGVHKGVVKSKRKSNTSTRDTDSKHPKQRKRKKEPPPWRR